MDGDGGSLLLMFVVCCCCSRRGRGWDGAVASVNRRSFGILGKTAPSSSRFLQAPREEGK